MKKYAGLPNWQRCVDVMARLIEKYGHQVLEKLEQDTPQTAKCLENDTQAKPPGRVVLCKF